MVGTERSRFFTLVRAVEFGSVNQRTFVVYFYFAAISGDFTGSFGDNLILQTARSGYNTFFGLVFSKEFFTGSFVVGVFLFHGFSLYCIHLGLHESLSFFFGHDAFAYNSGNETCQQVFTADGLCRVSTENLLVEAFYPLFAYHLSDLQTCHVSNVFLVDFACTFVETFQEVCHLSRIDTLLCEILIQTFGTCHTDGVR